MLKLKNVVKNYPVGDSVVEALKGVDLEFRKSEFVSILGPSGCGKTTLLNIIGGLDHYTSGDLIINGKSTKNFTDYDWDSYRNHTIGFVFQSYNLIHHQSVLGNVELALTLSGISKAERKKRAITALESVGLADKIYKKPNQLSGGQMQRVAIARAIVNNPDVILADEPTGAIDSETSIQILNILKEISKDRLVIMVTHNPELAKNFSTRIIRLLDGKVTGDTNPYVTDDGVEVFKKLTRKEKKEYKKNLTSMNFITAFSLSMKNLLTKKGRTILTAFAGSIGIIGIALVLSVSNGFQIYIDKMQTDTMSAYPLTISEETTDFTSLMTMDRRTDLEEYPQVKEIYINKVSEMLEGLNIKNNINEEYIEYVNNINLSLINTISFEYGIKMNIYNPEKLTPISTSNWSQLASNNNVNDPYAFIETQYDILEGNLPKNKNEIVLVVNTYNQISDLVLMSLGIAPDDNSNKVLFEDIIGKTYKVILNNALYSYDDVKKIFVRNVITENLFTEIKENVVDLRIVGIVRTNPDTEIGSISGSVGYSKELTDYLFERALTSQIVVWMNQEENNQLNPFTGEAYIPTIQKTAEKQRNDQLIDLGGIKKPEEIKIFPVDFNAKEQIKQYLDEYNNEKKEKAIQEYYKNLGISEDTATLEQQKQAQKVGKAAGVYYTDLMTLLVSSMNTLVKVISIVLIVFTSISLVVSSIMIGIITYISVLERTKEIGVLRSIGARKKDISRVFNAESIMIGLVAGLIGIGVTLLMLIPINIILERLVEISNLAVINPIHSIILIIISMILTFFSGLIPSRLAAKRDPVIALRTE